MPLPFSLLPYGGGSASGDIYWNDCTQKQPCKDIWLTSDLVYEKINFVKTVSLQLVAKTEKSHYANICIDFILLNKNKLS